MNRQYIEMIRKEIAVMQNGNVDNSAPVAAGLLITWIRPNEYKNSIAGEIKGMKLAGDKAYTTPPLDSEADLVKNQILKTSAIGRSVIKTEVIVAKSSDLLQKAFATLFGTALGLVWVGEGGNRFPNKGKKDNHPWPGHGNL